MAEINNIEFKLYLVTNRKLCKFYSLQELLSYAANSGIKAIQIRENDLPDEKLIKFVEQILILKSFHQVKFFINNNFKIVEKVNNIDGIHCKENNLGVSLIRKKFPKILIGVSCHSLKSALKAQKDGADFIVFGPIYSTPSKIIYGQPQGLNKLKEITSSLKLPVFAIGGITPERVKECLDLGAHGVAVMSPIMTAENVIEVINKYKNELGEL